MLKLTGFADTQTNQRGGPADREQAATETTSLVIGIGGPVRVKYCGQVENVRS